MKREKKYYLSRIMAVMLLLLVISCDDGRIYPEEVEDVTGGKGTMQVSFKGEEAWPQEYMLLFAALGEDSRMPVVSKIISQPSSSGEAVTVTLSGLDEKTKRLDIAVANKGRELLYSLYSYEVKDHSAEMTLPVSEIDLASYDRIQKQVFDAYCIRCHGAGEHAAANLNLTNSLSYKALVNQPSLLSGTEELLVEPNHATRSFLVEILEDDIIQYNHTDVLPEAELIDLIETWIKNGCKE